MAPDSHKVMPVFGSTIAGTLGLMDWQVGLFLVGKGDWLKYVGDGGLFEDDSSFPGVGTAVMTPEDERLEGHGAGVVLVWTSDLGVMNRDGRLRASG
jgi:hypothetical protein